ncbi:hypothetical protein GI582_07695 [Sulfitobacter sp. BDSS02]|nr:hypothetical protein [Sulfitobacter sp. BDSS02]MBR9852018.1 endonuclease/exonuclease/phosphatase family protein [Paracoccaceae bacterium]
MPFYHDLKTYDADDQYPDKQSWIASRLLALRHDLKEAILDRRRPNSLIIGSWNIRAFDDGIPRLDESYHYLAEIIAAFDICAIQEVKSDLGPLKRLLRLLGPNWSYFVSDVSTHRGGNNERMAFVYNQDKVIFRHLIGEIVLDNVDLVAGNQIARSPFFAAFQADWFRFCLCSAHIIYGKGAGARETRSQEIRAITRMLVEKAQKEDQVYILVGDMNIESLDGPIMQALRDSEMVIPSFPPTNLSGDKHYDQIAFTDKGMAERKTRLLRAGAFDWRRAVFGPYPAHGVADLGIGNDLVSRVSDAVNTAHYEGQNLRQRAAVGRPPYADFRRMYRTWMTYEMSDHLPVWIEIEIDYSDEYLARFL